MLCTDNHNLPHCCAPGNTAYAHHVLLPVNPRDPRVRLTIPIPIPGPSRRSIRRRRLGLTTRSILLGLWIFDDMWNTAEHISAVGHMRLVLLWNFVRLQHLVDICIPLCSGLSPCSKMDSKDEFNWHHDKLPWGIFNSGLKSQRLLRHGYRRNWVFGQLLCIRAKMLRVKTSWVIFIDSRCGSLFRSLRQSGKAIPPADAFDSKGKKLLELVHYSERLS